MYTLTNFHPERGKIPKHIGLIPDGSRRWAKIHNFTLYDAYLMAMHKIVKSINFFFQQEIKFVSIYLSSVHNFNRSKEEISAFCQAETKLITDFLSDTVEMHGTHVKSVGRLDVLPDYFRKSLSMMEEKTRSQVSTYLYLCVAYNPLA